MKLRINYRGALLIFNPIIFILLLFAAHEAQALSYIVTNTNNSGGGSLRQAMLNAEATSAADTIEFDIPGGGGHTITPLTSLPIMGASVTIDGYTQPGYAGIPLIEINAVNVVNGLHYQHPDSGTRTFIVRGLIINRASGSGLLISSPGTLENLSTTITGCFIGTNSLGTTDLGNGGNGIEINARNAIVGGTGFGDRNVISGNGGNGISYKNETGGSSDGIDIYSNLIGTNAAGTADLGNSLDGIYIGTGQPFIGGTSSGGVSRGNIISGNGGNGIHLNANTQVATIQRNLIGTNAAGTGDLGNTLDGILIEGSNNHLIGSSTNSSNGNTISGNGENGILLSLGVDAVQIFGNRIGSNSAGTGNLGNDGNGILIFNSANTEIGLAGNNTARNIIVRNDLNGIFLNGLDSDDNVIQNNFIGTIPAGTALGNFGDGILITGGGSNTIGGTTANAGNTIGLNIGNGVNISSSFSSGNLIRQMRCMQMMVSASISAQSA